MYQRLQEIMLLLKVKMAMRFCAQEHQLASKDSEHKGYNTSSSRKALPKYDFSEAKMYCALGAHRIFTMKTLDEEEKLFIDSDKHYVFCRPKFYADSSGRTWAYEEMEHTQENSPSSEKGWGMTLSVIWRQM